MKSFWGKLLVVFIFGLLPATSLYLAAGRILDQRQSEDFDSAKTELRHELIRIADASSPGSFYFRVIESMMPEMLSEDNQQESRLAVIRKVQSICGQDMAIYMFDNLGMPENLPGYSPPNRFVVGKLWDILAETPEYSKGDEQRQLKRLQILLGAEASAGVIKNHEGQLLSLKKRRSSGYLFWKRKSPDSLAGVVVIVFPVLKPQQILSGPFRKHFASDLRLAFWNHEQDAPVFTSDQHADFNYMRSQVEKSSSEGLVNAGRLWITINTGSGVFLGSRELADNRYRNATGMLNLLFAVLATGMIALLFSRSFDLQKIYMRTGSKLLALLLVAIAIPTAGLLLTGVTAISTHEKVLWSRLENDVVTRLTAIEDDFAEEERNFVRHCNVLHEMLLKDSTEISCQAAAESMLASGQAIRIDLMALDGESLGALNKGSWFEGLEKSVDAYLRYLIEKRLAHRMRAEKIELRRKQDPVLNDIFGSTDFGFATITSAPGQLHNVRFGLNELMWYWNFIDVPGHPAAVISVFQARDIARKNFLKKVVRAGDEPLAVFDASRQTWLSEGFQATEESEILMRAAILTGKPQLRRISAAGRRWLALAYPGRVLAPYSLINLTDEQKIRQPVRVLYYLLATSIAIIFGVALLIARLLTETFLKPVTELDRGMHMVKQRRPEARVEIDVGDEFGELGKAFNEMVDELNEMQLARSVQEALFPQEKLKIDGFDTEIFNLAAADLGGDYCDYVKLDEHRYLFLIGDVSGHGTSAALCMAMAKATVFKACRDGLNFTELPGRISSILLQTVKRKKMMTMLFMLLDSADCTLQLINAGHNWPLIIRKDGSVEEISLTGMPLGVRESKRKPEHRTILLSQGDALFSYTDALIECQAPDGRVYGHEAMYLELAKMSKLSPAATVAKMKAVWDNFMAGGPQQDDLTMLVIKNMTKEPADVS
ncbi:MAG: SpoIIE family protein phosphatase [Candidatus Riflebacteria bacterium]|nr:SpoIIE family protein phosphatase [Candidatus Riflebacteria bacterium]